MIYQLRTYTVNSGKMDSWLKFFHENIVPLHEKLGIKIDSEWVREDKSQFIWVRSFADAEEAATKEAAFYASPEWAAVGDTAKSHIARGDVTTMEPVSQAVSAR